MDLTTLLTNCRSLTDETDTNQLSDSIITVFLNRRYQDLISKINLLGEDFFGTTDATLDLVASQREYTLTQDADSLSQTMKIRRVEVTYDGTNWKIALPMNLNEKITSDSEQDEYDIDNPRYYIFGNSIGLIPDPTSSVTNGLKIWYIRRAGDLGHVSATTQTVGTGLSDLTPGGTHTTGSDVTYTIRVDSVGATDTFQWSTNGGTTWTASTVSMTGSAQTLSNGVTVTFAAITGHTLLNTWTFIAYSDAPVIPMEYHNLLVFGAAADIKKRDDNSAGASLFEADYEKGVKDMLNQLKTRQIQKPNVITDVGEYPYLTNINYIEDGSIS